MKSVFAFDHYKDYLVALSGPKEKRSGFRSRMAAALSCQPTFVSQVLSSTPNFSLEQGYVVSDFLGHSKDEKKYFLLLIEVARAGSKSLEKYFKSEIEEFKKRRLVLTERENRSLALPEITQAIYYSSWHFAAIHVALTVPELRRADSLSEYFRIPKKRILEVLDFLVKTQLAKKSGAEYLVGNVKVRLGNSSSNIIKHHTNWRNQAIESLERENENELHYSGAISLSDKDIISLKEKLLDFIQDCVHVVADSKEEKVFCLNLDFFNLQRP